MPALTPRRRPDQTLLNENRVGFDGQGLVALIQQLAGGPMGYGATSVKQTGLGQQEGSATDRRGARAFDAWTASQCTRRPSTSVGSMSSAPATTMVSMSALSNWDIPDQRLRLLPGSTYPRP
jgi:hypothetical protein